MTHTEQIDAFASDLDNLVGRYCAEFELTTAAAIGVLTMKVHTLIAHAITKDDEGFDPESMYDPGD